MIYCRLITYDNKMYKSKTYSSDSSYGKVALGHYKVIILQNRS